MAETLRHFLALLYLPSCATRKVQQWLAHGADLAALFEEKEHHLLALGFNERETKALLKPAWHEVDKALHWAMAPDCHLITVMDAAYPALLREIADPPWVLFVTGKREVLTSQALAVVGSRAASERGAHYAQEFSKAFSAAGFAVVSGLALGVDACAHRGALQAPGSTIAVMGTGADSIYPGGHASLANAILEKGALVSEFPLGTKPRPEHFPRRNRIIAGLSLGVLVVEAKLKSGSLITARLAAEQNRDVFAIPGPIHLPGSRGCHALIRQGAKLVESPQDVLEEFGVAALAAKPAKPSLSDEEEALLAWIDYEITPIDVILWRSGLTAAAVSAMLLALELNRYILAVPGG